MKGQVFHSMGMTVEGNRLLSEAFEIRRRLEPRDTRSIEELKMGDFDVLVAFGSR